MVGVSMSLVKVGSQHHDRSSSGSQCHHVRRLGCASRPVRRLARDDAVRVVVLTGAGEDFCSGADVGDDPRRGRSPTRWDACRRSDLPNLFTLPKPTIARVDGVRRGPDSTWRWCVRLGDRSRFGEIFARRGLGGDFGGSFLLPRIVGMQRAKELVLLADVIDAARAFRDGAREPGRAERRTRRSGRVRNQTDGWPTVALATSTKLLSSVHIDARRALDAEGIGQAYQFTTRDTVEAMTAFVEKRDPNFEGR